MPKKESAKERAASKAAEAADAAARAAEDAEWSQGAKGGDKKAAAAAKREEELARKAERAALEAEELATESSKMAAKQPAKKLTQAQIQANFIIPKKKVKNKKPEPEIEENINHKMRDEAIRLAEAGVDSHHASGVDGATALLTMLHTGNEPEVDAHPERRRKAAFKAYEEREIPIIREENKGLKLSQVKEIIFKNWQKSPENPVNQDAA